MTSAPELALRYRWTCELADGSRIVQTDDDTCPLHPPDADGNGHTQMRHVDEGAVAWFMLEGPEGKAAVDLRDGHFELNGAVFWLHDRHHEQPARTLVYHRRVTRQRRIDTGAETVHIAHVIGWSAGDLERTIGVE